MPPSEAAKINRDKLNVEAGKTITLEARGGIEPPIKVLQTFALPLGDRASGTTILSDGYVYRSSGIALPYGRVRNH